jgi:hypothetical protein
MLEPDKYSVTGTYEDRAAAWAEIEASQRRFRELHAGEGGAGA